MSKFCGLCGKPIESGTVCAQCGGSQSPVKPVQLARGGATPPKKSKKKLRRQLALRQNALPPKSKGSLLQLAPCLL